MDTKTSVINAKPFICIAAAAACALLSGALQAHEVTVRIPVSAAGLDLSQPAAARELYRRIRVAARLACGDHYQVGLEPIDNFGDCYEQVLGGAIRSANQLELTMAYLATHTREDAAAHGIRVPASVAAK